MSLRREKSNGWRNKTVKPRRPTTNPWSDLNIIPWHRRSSRRFPSGTRWFRREFTGIHVSLWHLKAAARKNHIELDRYLRIHNPSSLSLSIKATTIPACIQKREYRSIREFSFNYVTSAWRMTFWNFYCIVCLWTNSESENMSFWVVWNIAKKLNG